MRKLEADLKHITQSANQVAESGTFDWQLPPRKAAVELAESLNRFMAQVKQLLQKVASEKEDKIFQTDKMASLGKMVAGVAHEINNPLNCIYGNLDHISNYHRIKHGFQLVRQYGNLPMIEGYPGLLSQVFINLISNSLDALEEKRPALGIKEITITTSLLDEDAVEITADNGPGISGDDRSKMFKTFFTTKPPGVGTGLGLANR